MSTYFDSPDRPNENACCEPASELVPVQPASRWALADDPEYPGHDEQPAD